MTRAEITVIVTGLMGDVLGRQVTATAETLLVRDLGFDSVRVLELVAEIEERFDITVPINEVTRVRSVGEIVERIHAEISGRST